MKGTSRASFILAIIGVCTPTFGIIVAGLSGLFAMLSLRKGNKLAISAVVVNLCNLLLLSPLFILSLMNLEVDLFNYEMPYKHNVFAFVLVIQLLALVIYMRSRRLRAEKRRAAKQQRETYRASSHRSGSPPQGPGAVPAAALD